MAKYYGRWLGVSVLAVLTALSARAGEPESRGSLVCRTGRIHATVRGEDREEQRDYCFTANQERFVSVSCKDQHCEAFKAAEKDLPSKTDITGWNGKQASKLCKALGGSVLWIAFEDQMDRWVSQERCYFQEDRSFVDTGTLLGAWLAKHSSVAKR